MAISAEEFVRRVTGGSGSVTGEQVDGTVEISQETIALGDWSDCKFNASVQVRGCAAGVDICMRNVSIEGDLCVDDLRFSKGGFSAQGLYCRGSVVLRGVNNSYATSEVTVKQEGETNSVVGYHGLDLMRVRVDGNLRVENCRGWVSQGSSHITSAICMDFARISGHLIVGSRCRGFIGLFLNQAHVGGMLMASMERPSDTEADWSFVLMNGLACGNDMSIGFTDSAGFKTLQARACKVRGDLVIEGTAQRDGTRSHCGYLALQSCDVQGGVFLKNFSHVVEDVRQGTISLNRADALGITLQSICVRTIHLLDSRVIGDIQLLDIEADDLDLYGASAKDIWLHQPKAPSAPADEGSAIPRACGTVDLGNVHVAGLLTIADFRAERLTARYSQIRAIRLSDLEVERMEMSGCRLSAYLDVSGSRVGTFTGNNIAGTASFRSTHPDAHSGEPGADTMVPETSTFQFIELAESQWESVDLGHIRFPATATQGHARVHCPNIVVAHDFRLRPDQFQGTTAGDTLILDVSGASIGRMDLELPLPGKMQIKGANVASWGLKEDSAEAYEDIMQSAAEYDQGAYLDLENRLENAGLPSEADALHRMWRRHEERKLVGSRKLRAALHRILLGYGTQRTRILSLWLAAAIVCWVLVTWQYGSDIQVTPSALATLQECGSSCVGIPSPSLATTWLQRAVDSVQLVLRSGVPIIDLGLAPELQAVPRTPGFWALATMKLLGWIIWPLFLTSAVASFFPKRHR